MVKVSTGDIAQILRRFGVAGDEYITPSQISYVLNDNPSATNTRVQFRFEKDTYELLYDDTAEDDEAYIREQLMRDGVEPSGALLRNPESPVETYALSHEAKGVYLFKRTPLKRRLDVVLGEQHDDLSRSTIQKYIKAGYVMVNGVVASKPSTDIAAEDTVVLNPPERQGFADQTLPIVYQDEHVMVIDKPTGILTHAKGALSDEFTVAGFFGRHSTYKSDTNRPGIVHRLDRDTSGILIGALDDEAGNVLGRQFSDRKAKKVYYAVVAGHPKQEEAVIDIPIGRNPSAPSTFRADPGGKSAQTYYKIESYGASYALVRLEPRTGRTHQLRVHMAHIGTPIVGDRVYSQVSADRLYLHAHSLEITIPGSERKVFESPVPASFQELVDAN